eukprot:CAMPEP_0202401426 /NCGR_PEP_ID=MMETSP1128-20130828/3477_1 /ASSEMBLY_ACC=CAM_ASM_000463 /TAXON_ID=3047 /ORGANISM="Dunaliella tertiolecta, Strain CCMP1320" /LENGTH=684 /DNA_ID=CAMNT_0049005233 /DNA_START=86 /DNA_END=2140 /DNA_ORIENTATION=+
MGRLFVQYCEDDTARRYTCLHCGVDIASNSAVIWSGHMGMQKPAFLLRGTTGNVVPISKPRQERLHTGLYTLQTLGCRCCAAELGWLYVSCHGHAEHLYKQGCSLLEQAALRASPSRVSLANARQELRRMQQGQGGMQAPARPARHFEVGSSSRSGGSGTGALVGDGLGLRSSGVFTAEAYHRWNSSLRLHALHEDAMQEDEEGPGQQIAVVGGPGGGDASARGRAPFMSFNLADVPHQPQQAAAHQQEHVALSSVPRTGGHGPSPTLSASEHLARTWIQGRTQPSYPTRPTLQQMLTSHLEALERAFSGSSPAAVTARQAALTEMNQALNALHDQEQRIQHEIEAAAHGHREDQHIPGSMSERQEEGTDEHDDEELPEAGGPDEEALQREAEAAVAALEEAMDVTRLPEQAFIQATMRGAPSANVHRRLFLHGVQDAGVMNEDEEEVEEDDQRMGDGNEEEAVHFGLVAMGPSLEGGGEGEEEEVEEEGDLAILDVEQQRRDSDEAARAATFQALGEAQRSQARLEEQLMIDAFMEGMEQERGSDLEQILRTTNSSHNPGDPPRMPPPPWWAGGGVTSRQGLQHHLDHHLAERQLMPSQRGYRVPPFLTRSLRRNGGASGSEVRIAWPATAASERRREIGDGGREGTRGVEAPGAGAEPIPCLPRSIQPLSLAPPLDRQRSPL